MKITIVIEEFTNELIHASSLVGDPCTALDDDPKQAERTVLRRFRDRFVASEPTHHWHYADEAEIEISTVELELKPAETSPLWADPIPLHFPAIVRRREPHQIIYLPTLNLQVLGESDRDMTDRLEKEIRMTLLRTGAGNDLLQLARLQQEREVKVIHSITNLEADSPWQRYQKMQKQEKAESLLSSIGRRLRARSLKPAWEMDMLTQRLAEALHQSVLLIGPSGRGKTALFHELVRQRKKHRLAATEFWETSGARLVAGMSGFGMWEERCQELVKETKKRPVILHVGSLKELVQVGKSAHNHRGMASFLRPFIARGELTIVAECTPTELPALEKEDPHLLQLLNRIELPEPSDRQMRRILARAAPALSQEARDCLYALHRRYATYSAVPGRPIRFVRGLLQDIQQPDVGDITQRFSEETGLPHFMLNDDISLDLDALKTWFGERVMGQPEAIRRVTDLLALTKTRLTRPGKPLASLLFIGPTGVGKTEVAKALAACLFGSEDRMCRFDMSEYADPASANRLVGGLGQEEGLLTARMREQPFTLLLFDEFEKANPSVFDLFLQILGEARLTDAAGRLADFRNAVILLTSNLGAESFRSEGFGFVANRDDAVMARAHFQDEVRKFLRPEMFNRIDAIVPFNPLSAEVCEAVTRKELKRALARPGVADRPVNLQVEESAVRLLVEKGFDPRYGARPLKRIIERELLAPLSTRLNDYPFELPLEIQVEDVDPTEWPWSDILNNSDEGRVPEKQDSGRQLFITVTPDEAAENSRATQVASYAMQVRWRLDRVQRSQRVLGLKNTVERLRQREVRMQRLLKKRPKSPPIMKQKELNRMYHLMQILDRLEQLRHETYVAESDVVLTHVQRQEAETAKIERLHDVRTRLNTWMLDVHRDRIGKRADEALLVVLGDWELDLIELYLEVANLLCTEEVTSQVYQVLPTGLKPESGDVELSETFVARSLPWRKETDCMEKGGLGFLLQMQGDCLGMFFVGEGGRHIRQNEKSTQSCRVDVLNDFSYEPDAPPKRKQLIEHVSKTRTCRMDRKEVYHHPTQERFAASGNRKQVPQIIAHWMQQRLEREIASTFDLPQKEAGIFPG